MKTYLLSIFLFVGVLVYAQPCGVGFSANGADDFITIPNTDAINLQNTRNRTIEFWFKTSDITTRQVIYEEGAQVNALLLYIENGFIHSGGFRSNANNNSNRRLFRSGAGEIAVDTWYHVALVLDDSGTFQFRWFLNGVLQDQQAGVQINNHSGNVSIGRNGGQMRYPSTTNWVASSVGGSTSETYDDAFTAGEATSYNFTGELALFRIWNTPRSQTEIDTNKEVFLSSGTNLVAYMENGVMQYESNGSATIDATASGNGNATAYTWTGATNSSWATSSNWTSGNVPDPTKLQSVTIQASANTPQINTERKIGQLTIESGATVEILAGGTLNVFYGMTNNGTVEVRNNGSFLYNACDDISAIAGSGEFIVDRDSPNYPIEDLFSIWSSPVVEADANVGDIFGNIQFIAYRFDASLNPGQYVQVGGTYQMPTGQGLFVRPDSSTGVETRTFQGQANNGDIDVSIFYNSAADNFNLIGNPYQSAIDWFKVYDDNSDVLEGTIFYWDQSFVGTENSESDFIQFNQTGSNPPGANEFISTAQGVFVKSLQAGTIRFKNTHRVPANNTQFFRGGQQNRSNTEDRSWFQIEGNGRRTTILIGFLDGATDCFDSEFDGAFGSEGANLEFYSFIDTGKYSIQGRNPDLTTEHIVPLGYQALINGTYTISIDQEYLDPDTTIILEDMVANSFTDLKAGNYTFDVTNADEVNDRFQLRFLKSTLAVGDELIQNKAQLDVVVNGDELLLYTDNTSLIEDISIYDMAGKQVLSISEGNQPIHIGNLARGVYIVKVGLDSGGSLARKFIR